MSIDRPLARYNAKRDFARTPEPAGEPTSGGRLSFVIQKHWASRLHYDFRLELDGVLLSWAVPKGPSFDPKVKRMAIHVEDHPVSYGSFEGRIPDKQYGAGTVIVWDRGTWAPVGDPRAGLAAGKLVFDLHGEKLAGRWELVRIAKPGDRQEPWILFKKRDDLARASDEYDVVSALPDSVIGRTEHGEAGAPIVRGAGDEPVVQKVASKGASNAATKKARENAAKKVAKKAMPKRSATKRVADAMPGGAVRSALPDQLAPQLATLVRKPPTGDEWSVEAKFDGYRVMARIANGEVRLITRNGNDWTDRLASLARAVETLGIDEGWLDGEMVVLNDAGGQDFNALQNAIDRSSNDVITYFLFDVPYLGGYDLRSVPLSERRKLLKSSVERIGNDRVRFSDDFPASPEDVLKAACAMHLEGVIVKRRDAPYVSARNDHWLKLKCTLRQEFVIGGYTDRANSSTEIGNLFLGVYEDGKLRYAGAMGTGWSLATARALKGMLKKLEVERSPFEIGSVRQTRWAKRAAGAEKWVKPTLVAEAAFAEWTPDGHLRHASFQGLRTDKPARSVVREVAEESVEADVAPSPSKRGVVSKTIRTAGAKHPATARKRPAAALPATPSTASPAGKAVVSGIRVSSPERVIDPTSGATKLELVRYYDSVADLIMPHLRGRPVSLVRGPSGITGELFFQKHMDKPIAGVTELDIAVWPGHAALIQIDTREALLSAAQMNTVEFHTWNAESTRIDRPDRMIFDLDPGEGLSWAHVQEAAVLTRAILDELGLASFLKTSGGKGLHVVVPITPKAGWDMVKGFSQAIVQHLAKTIPERFVAKSGPSNRIGKIFVDYLRNGHGATTAAAFSVRARPGLGVSIPVAWDTLESIRSGAQWTVATARDHLSFGADPWLAYASTRQSLTTAMKRLGYRPPVPHAPPGPSSRPSTTSTSPSSSSTSSSSKSK